MANPYSYDLRKKVIESIELNGMKCCEASAAFVEENGDKTQAEMAKLWEEEISERTICRALKKIGFT